MYAENKGKEMYSVSKISNREHNKHSIYYGNRNFIWEYRKKEHFYDFTYELKNKIQNKNYNSVWVMIYSHSDYAFNSLFSCDIFQKELQETRFENGFLAYKFDYVFLKNKLLNNNNLFEHCFSKSKIKKISGPILKEYQKTLLH